MRHEDPVLFALDGAHALGDGIARELGVPVSETTCVEFDDGEHKLRAARDVEGCDVFVVQSLYQDADRSIHDRLCRLLFFLGALRDAGAARMTAVIPYLCYARVDRKTEPRDPVTTRYVAAFLEAAGVNRVIALDVHNIAAFQNAYRVPTVHLEAGALFAAHLAPVLSGTEVVVLSPDVGGIKRAEAFCNTLADTLDGPVDTAFMEKRRVDERVAGDRVIGDLEGRAVVILDDMVCSGRTLARAINACERAGATPVYAAATHGVFTTGAETALNAAALAGTLITDSIPYPRPGGPSHIQHLNVLTAANLFGTAIKRMHSGD